MRLVSTNDDKAPNDWIEVTNGVWRAGVAGAHRGRGYTLLAVQAQVIGMDDPDVERLVTALLADASAATRAAVRAWLVADERTPLHPERS